MNVSVAICTWNRAELLAQTLGSLRDLRVPHGVDWELLVVDNNSSDDTPAVIDAAASHLPILHLSESRPGLSYARNLAVAESHGEWILFTDDDVLVDAEWLTATLDAFRQLEADVVYGRSLPRWETAPPSWFSDLFMGKFALLDHGDEPMVVTNSLQKGFGLNHAFRRAALERIGGYRTDMGLRHGHGAGGEDSEMFRRAHRAGLRIAYTPHSVVQHFIPTERCQKAFSRQRAWRGSEDYLNLLNESDDQVPRVFGIPRFLFRRQLHDVRKYLFGIIRRRPDEAFYYELRLLQFVGLLLRSWERRKNA